jgi:hypothetical protein
MTNHGNRSTLSDFITENLGRGLGKGEDKLIDVCLSHRKKGVDTHARPTSSSGAKCYRR